MENRHCAETSLVWKYYKQSCSFNMIYFSQIWALKHIVCDLEYEFFFIQNTQLEIKQC